MAWWREWLRGEPIGPVRTAEPDGPGGAPRGTDGPRRRAAPTAPTGEQHHPGEHFGLPESGRDSVATLPVRGGQFLLDIALASVLTAILTYPATSPWPSLAIWGVLLWPSVALVGRTPAMAVLGMRVARVDGVGRVGPFWALMRTVSLFFVVPAFLVDRDARGLQDRISRTIVLRTR